MGRSEGRLHPNKTNGCKSFTSRAAHELRKIPIKGESLVRWSAKHKTRERGIRETKAQSLRYSERPGSSSVDREQNMGTGDQRIQSNSP